MIYFIHSNPNFLDTVENIKQDFENVNDNLQNGGYI